MKILISGASGLIGSALTSFLPSQRCDVIRLVRAAPRSGREEIYWNPDEGEIDSEALEGLDAIVHLAGENLATGRWTTEKKARIRHSRVNGTALLSRTIAKLRSPPKVMACASAVGYYGNRGAERLTEESSAGHGFLASVCQEWEAAATPAMQAGVRVVYLRFGIILTAQGGALARMVPLFKAGVGGVLGSGEQYWSWMAIEDLLRGVHHVLTSENLSGPINFVSPNPVTNREFTRALGQALARPAFLAVPAFALRWMVGEMADEALLASARAEPAKLTKSGFQFQFPKLETALEHLLVGRQ